MVVDQSKLIVSGLSVQFFKFRLLKFSGYASFLKFLVVFFFLQLLNLTLDFLIWVCVVKNFLPGFDGPTVADLLHLDVYTGAFEF